MEWRKRKPLIEYSEFDTLYEQLAKINGIEYVDEFLEPSVSNLHEPREIRNMEVARDRILQGIHSNERVIIFSDVDADGCSSTAVMFNYLRKFTNNVSYFHAQREDGHGISTAINKIPSGTELLIIVDSSSSEVGQLKQVRDMGIETIVLDHHPIDVDSSDYCILVNPQHSDDKSKNKDLCGSSLVWKMCKLLDESLNTYYADDLIDCAALGTISDMMDVYSSMENRFIVHKGLDNIVNKGILAILKLKNKNPKYVTSTIFGYDVAPFINAAARMNEIELALDLLTNDDEDECLKIAKKIEKLNNTRKKQQAQLIKEFDKIINKEDKIVIILSEEVNKSFAGLIANDIAQKYKRPCLIMSLNSEKTHYSGSYRSYGGFKLKEFFNSLDTVDTVGGHEPAGGASVLCENIEAFKVEANQKLQHMNFEQVIEYDLEIKASEVTTEFIRNVDNFYRICGKGFEKAKFLVVDLNLYDVDEIKVMGNGDTVKIPCDELVLMKFKTNEEYKNQFYSFANIEAVGTLAINAYYNFGKKQMEITNQLLVEDLKLN